jgi:hypothetical protein
MMKKTFFFMIPVIGILIVIAFWKRSTPDDLPPRSREPQRVERKEGSSYGPSHVQKSDHHHPQDSGNRFEDDHVLPDPPSPETAEAAFRDMFGVGYQDDGSFLVSNEKVSWHNCSARLGTSGSLAEVGTFTDALKHLDDLPLLDWNRYFEGEGHYYQLSAHWDGEEPRRYKVSLFKSKQLAMDSAVEIRLKGGQGMDLDGTMETMDEVTSLLISQGITQRGSSRVIGSPEDSDALVEIRNGRIVRLEHHQLRCGRNHLQETLGCRCLES